MWSLYVLPVSSQVSSRCSPSIKNMSRLISWRYPRLHAPMSIWIWSLHTGCSLKRMGQIQGTNFTLLCIGDQESIFFFFFFFLKAQDFFFPASFSDDKQIIIISAVAKARNDCCKLPSAAEED